MAAATGRDQGGSRLGLRVYFRQCVSERLEAERKVWSLGARARTGRARTAWEACRNQRRGHYEVEELGAAC